jgi:hypothetical protein
MKVLRAIQKEHGKNWNDCWDLVPPDYNCLHQLFGGFAAIFPNNATVECVFSIMRY